MSKTTETVTKARDWTFILYPESAPEHWREILDETHLRWIESPLHDKDVNADGEKKKSHWHILLSFDGPVTQKAVKRLIEPLNGPVPQKIGSSKGLVRYMIHMDNPEKYQYSINDIVAHNGADIQSYFELTATNRLTVMKEIITFIYDERIDNFADFLMIAIEKSDDWFSIAINNNTLAINKMIDAMWHKNRQAQVNKVDDDEQ